MAQWFIYISELEVAGPLTPSELLGKVRAGEVVADTRLRKDDSAWFPAREVGGLFDAATKPTIQWRCPGCQSKLTSAPPCACMNCGRNLEIAIQERIEHHIESPADSTRHTSLSSSMKNWLAEKIKRRKA